MGLLHFLAGLNLSWGADAPVKYPRSPRRIKMFQTLYFTRWDFSAMHYVLGYDIRMK